VDLGITAGAPLMLLSNTLGLALRSIRRNLLRSFLTILGIVIGVSAVITMVTLGNGATQAVQMKIASLGSNLLMVRPGQRQGPGGGGGAHAPSFKEADAEAIINSIIPFRGLVREMTGAAPADRHMNAVVDAGLARRGFLRGVHLRQGCKTRF